MVLERECQHLTAVRFWQEEDLKAERSYQPKDAFVRLFDY